MKKLNNYLQISNNARKNFLDFSDYSEEIVIFLNTQLQIIDFNKAAKDFFHWNNQSMIKQSFLEWCLKEKLPSPITNENIKQIFEQMCYLEIENKYDNYFVQWKIVPNLNKNNKIIGLVLIGLNITSAKNFKQEKEKLSNNTRNITGNNLGIDRPSVDYLMHVYHFLENIISGMPCYVYWKDCNFVYLGCNNLIAKAMRYTSRQEIVGKTDYDFGWDKEKVDQFRKIDEKIIETGTPIYNLEEKVPLSNGEEIFVLTNKVPIFDENKKVVGIAGIGVDITERKIHEQELLKAKEAAEAANKLKTEFVRNLEHDIRTPISGILGMTKILEDNEPLELKRQIINDIYVCTEELLEFCSSVINFSKIESGVFPILSKRFNLRNLLDRLIALETPAAKFKKLDFVINCEEDLPTILIGDSYRLERILINLLSNAIKFTQFGGVTLNVKKEKLINKNEIILCFEVKDTGIGIPTDKHHIIFDKFSRISPSSQGIYQGQGLGLHIVKQFIDEANGNIKLESSLGSGSNFICTIPYKISRNEEEGLENFQKE